MNLLEVFVVGKWWGVVACNSSERMKKIDQNDTPDIHSHRNSI